MFYSFDHFVTFLFLSKNHNNCIQYVCNIFHANYNLNDFFFFLMEIFKFPNQRFWNIYKSFSSPFFFSQSLKEVTTAAIYEVIIVIFSVNLPMVFINKFFLIQSLGEPPEHHLGEVRPKKFKLHKIS